MTVKVKLKFFAGIKNQIGRENMDFDIKESAPTVDNLIKELILKLGPGAEAALLTSSEKSYKFLLFINKKMTPNPKTAELKEGDLIYFMPPLSGG